MTDILPPPPKRRAITPPPYLPYSSVEPETWKAWGRRRSSALAAKAFVASDYVGLRVNNYTESLGSERFYPTTGDFPIEMEKCARILRSFTS